MLTANSVQADIVHKWVDAEGVTHYSDQLPEDEQSTKAAKQIAVSNTYSSSNQVAYREDYYSVTNQWARMKKERIERKQLQLNKKKQNATQHVTPQIVYLNQGEERPRSVYYPAYPTYLGRHGVRNNNFNYYPVRNRSNRYAGRSINSYSGSSCRLPRNSYSKRGGLGLSLTFR